MANTLRLVQSGSSDSSEDVVLSQPLEELAEGQLVSSVVLVSTGRCVVNDSEFGISIADQGPGVYI